MLSFASGETCGGRLVLPGRRGSAPAPATTGLAGPASLMAPLLLAEVSDIRRNIMDRIPARDRSCPLVLLALVLLTGNAFLAPPIVAEERFGEEISVVSVDIPVRVLRKGVPVMGLTADDFIVLDDGEPQEISGFEISDLRRAAAVAPQSAELEARADGETSSTADVPAPPAGRSFVVLFDFAYSNPGLLARSVAGIRTMLTEQLHPRDRAAIAIYDTEIRLLAGLTNRRAIHETTLDLVQAMMDRDAQRVRTAAAALEDLQATTATGRSGEMRALLDRFGSRAALALSGPIDLLGPSSSPTGIAEAIFDDGVDLVENPRAQQADFGLGGVESITKGDPFEISRNLAREDAITRVIRMAKGFADFVTLLRDVEGDKHMILVSQGFASRLLENTRITRALHAMFEAFERSGWKIQAIDLGGVPAASNNIQQAFSGPTGTPTSSGIRGFTADALFHLAEETGGRLIENENRIARATARILERTSVTYHLSFERADVPADGAFRKIKIKLRDGLQKANIQHRPGYFAPKPLDQSTEIERRLADAEMLLGTKERRELDVAMLAVASPGNSMVPIVIQVNGTDLLAGTGHRTERIDLEMHVYALDQDDQIRDLVIESMSLDLDDVRPRLTATGLRHLAQLTLPPGVYRLRTLVRRHDDQRVFLASQPLIVPSANTLPWTQPLWLDATSSWLLTRNSALAGEPFTLEGRGFVPAPIPQVTSGNALPFVLGVPRDSDAQIAGQVVDASGALLPGRFSLGARVAAENGRDHLVGSLRTHGLRAGDYRLTVHAADSSGIEVARVESHFRIDPP